jgi:hypothetical protein
MRTTSRLALWRRAAHALCVLVSYKPRIPLCVQYEKAVDVCDFTYEVWYERSRRSKSAPRRRLNLRDRRGCIRLVGS